MSTRGFTSDNASGAHPDVLAALVAASDGHAASYGADPLTAALDERAREVFGPAAVIFPVFNGTGANVVGVTSLLQRWDAVVVSEHAHLANDESTAPQLIGGMAVRTLPAPTGKVSVADLGELLAADDGSVHHARPAAVSLTQSTELGTVYTPEELVALVRVAHGRGVRVHVDGARLANAAVRLGTSLAALTADLGIDVVSFGATKNGTLYGDAVVVLDPALVEPVARLRKATTQLASKMRFVSAQLLTLLADDLWRTTAAHANGAADHLAGLLRSELGIEPAYPVEANAVFIPVPQDSLGAVTEHLPVLRWDREVVRAVCSFDTTEEDVSALVTGLARLLD